MYNTILPSVENINLAEYRDRVLGCWTGKNIGGTLGEPFEGQRDMNSVTFYTRELNGVPAPNDDLDLQLVWMLAVEEKGLYRITPQVLGEYWLNCITGPWNEYGVCKSNMRNGFYPPLSGSVNNERWKFSNGAWIRSEIWACLFPGSPDEAVCYAYMDACCDHCGEGIYAEMFTAALQSAAFVVRDIRQLIEIALAKIPPDCRIARVVRLVCEYYDKGAGIVDTREAIVKDSEDLGFFQAPGNIGFVILGLLFGEGDFGKSICLAVNCGDDTDCTAGTVGATLGIMYGRSHIPVKWVEPIGESIKTCSITTYDTNGVLSYPKTVGELTDRITKLAILARLENPTLPDISKRAASVSSGYLEALKDSAVVRARLWNRSPYELLFRLPFVDFAVDYEGGPLMESGESKRLTLKLFNTPGPETTARIQFHLPEGWRMSPAPGAVLTVKCVEIMQVEVTLTAGEFPDAFVYLPVDVRLCGRLHPTIVHLPVQSRGTAGFTTPVQGLEFSDDLRRRRSRYAYPLEKLDY